ncbi:MAG TPA: FAD-dependent oxidoreductase [Methylovirgula sp.]
MGPESRPRVPHIAIVGAGPSGLFAAQNLRRLVADAAIDVFDRLPVPFGLIRYGVAADHQGVKAVARQFERLFEREGVRFFGNVHIGRDISVEELTEFYDVALLAAGLAGDRRLGIEGESLPGVLRAGPLTRWLNSHPDEAAFRPKLGARVVIIGNGNVALDIARLLLKTPQELSGSDLSSDRIAYLQNEGICDVEIVGRGGPGSARFDPAMLKQLASLGAIQISVDWPPQGQAAFAQEDSRSAACIAALQAIDGHGCGTAPRRLRFRFNLVPTAIEGTDHVTGVRFNAGGDPQRIRADSVVGAIGFAPDENVPVDLPRGAGDEVESCGWPRVFTAGWFGRGPRGAIAENRLDARAVAESIAAQIVRAGILPGGRNGGVGALALLAERRVRHVDYAGWLRIRDAEESARTADLVRLKINDWTSMMALADAPHLLDAE